MKKEMVTTMGAFDTMVATYAKMVMAGKLDIEKVPVKFRESVREYIANHTNAI